MLDFQKDIRFSLKLILSPQGRQQNLSVETDTIDTADPCYPHDNIVESHLCDECMNFMLSSVCHTLLSILCLLLWQVC